jgi:hypothetical protein
MWDFLAVPGTPTTTGEVDVIIKAYDAESFGASWFFDILPPTHALYDEQIWCGFPYVAVVSECPACGITDIHPNSGDGALTGVTVTGTDILAGPSLGFALQYTGESDIVATNVVWVNATTVTGDLNIAGTAPEGDWDVVLYNGCGTPAVLADGFTVSHTYAEHFDSNPGDWYFGTYQYWSGCTQGAPTWRSDSPYGTAAGALACPATGSILAGGAVCTMVSPGFDIPSGASEVNLRARVMFDLVGSYDYYTQTNFKLAVGTGTGIGPYTVDGQVGASTILTLTTAHGGTQPTGIWGTGGSGPMSSQLHWQGSLNDWPTNIANYVDIVVPASFYGQTVKFAFQSSPDWCSYPGANTGIVLDDFEVIAY